MNFLMNTLKAGWTKTEPTEMELSVAYMGPLATLSSHLEGLTPSDTRSHPQDGVQIYPKDKYTTQNHDKKAMHPAQKLLLNSHIG